MKLKKVVGTIVVHIKAIVQGKAVMTILVSQTV